MDEFDNSERNRWEEDKRGGREGASKRYIDFDQRWSR